MEALLEAALRLAAPLLIAALGELIVERAGGVNIGIEGMMLGGAFAGFATAVATDSAGAGVLAAALAGLAVGFWKDRSEVAGADDLAVFEPEMEAARRDELYAGWQRAVGRSLDWAQD